MRKFYIQNETGERVALNSESGIFLSNPAGLGVAYENGYADAGKGFFRRVELKDPQNQVTCSLNFLKNAYGRYQEFVNWCEAAKSLALVYKPGDTEYYRDVDIAYLTKTEITQGKWMEIPAALICLSPWYLPTPLALNFETDPENAMTYDFTYNEDLIYGGAGDDLSVEISAGGHIPAALTVTLQCEAVNPAFILTGVVSGEVYGECRVTGEFAASDTLSFSTAYMDSYCKKIAADGTETDLLDDLDITADPFFRVPVNEPCKLAVAGVAQVDSSTSSKISAQLYTYYRSV